MSAMHFQRRLDPERIYKPLDFGNGLLGGSVTHDGRLLAIGTYHPLHGYMTLSGAAPFPAEQRCDQAAVRAYRASLAEAAAPAFGLRLLEPTRDYQAYLLADTIPHIRFRAGPLIVHVTTWAPHVTGEPQAAAVQEWSFHNPSSQPVSITYSWTGPCFLGRASYTQLTEQGALPQLPTMMHLSFRDGQLCMTVPGGELAAALIGLPPGPAWQCDGHAPLSSPLHGQLMVQPGRTAKRRVIYALGQSSEQACALAELLAAIDLQGNLEQALRLRQDRVQQFAQAMPEPLLLMLRRAYNYAIDCCALPVRDATCLLTDHQILPLSWTRDAYFILQGLCVGQRRQDLELLRRHLRWLFEVARRPHGYWGRAYLANGYPKDEIFQLDQQCYPLLELADFAALGGDEATLASLLRYVPVVLEAILACRAPDAALFTTEETPADDPLPLPYHFSSHVLLWYTLRRLVALQERWPFTTLNLAALAEQVRADAYCWFVAQHQGRRLFAYATDLKGSYHFYHDANDLPTVLAPLWGFCSTADPLWRTTMEFALSPENQAGYYQGRAGGLGSIHTPGAWPLGDVQELIYARLIRDTARAETVLNRMATTACWDGSLPEARDPDSGAVRSRHWFAWPGAALLAALLHPLWHLQPG